MTLNKIAPTNDAAMMIHISKGTVFHGGVVSKTFNTWKQNDRNAKPTETMNPAMEAKRKKRRHPPIRFLVRLLVCWSSGSLGLSIGVPFVAC
jgi:hypothetical protein